MAKWLDDIKVGDKVIVHSGFSSVSPTIKLAKKVTRHHIILDEASEIDTKFQIRTGRPVGATSRFSRHIEAWTEERWNEIQDVEEGQQEFKQRRDLSRELSEKLQRSFPTLKQLEQIRQILTVEEQE